MFDKTRLSTYYPRISGDFSAHSHFTAHLLRHAIPFHASFTSQLSPFHLWEFVESKRRTNSVCLHQSRMLYPLFYPACVSRITTQKTYQSLLTMLESCHVSLNLNTSAAVVTFCTSWLKWLPSYSDAPAAFVLAVSLPNYVKGRFLSKYISVFIAP